MYKSFYYFKKIVLAFKAKQDLFLDKEGLDHTFT